MLSYNKKEVFRMKQNITAKATVIALQFLLGAISVPWWIITYYMITGTLQGENTAPMCVPIGIGMLVVSLAVTFFLTKGAIKAFEKKLWVLIFTFIPFVIGVGIFFACAFWAVSR